MTLSVILNIIMIAIGVIIHMIGFGYVVDWLTRAIIGFKNSLKKRS